MAFKNATKAYLNGVTVGAADIDAGVIAADRLAAGANIFVLNAYQASPAAATGIIQYQAYGGFNVLETGFSYISAGTAASTIIDLHTGATKAAATTVLAAAKLKAKAATTLGVVAPSVAAVADNGFLRVDIDAVPSGTKSGLNVWVVCQRT